MAWPVLNSLRTLLRGFWEKGRESTERQNPGPHFRQLRTTRRETERVAAGHTPSECPSCAAFCSAAWEGRASRLSSVFVWRSALRRLPTTWPLSKGKVDAETSPNWCLSVNPRQSLLVNAILTHQIGFRGPTPPPGVNHLQDAVLASVHGRPLRRPAAAPPPALLGNVPVMRRSAAAGGRWPG